MLLLHLIVCMETASINPIPTLRRRATCLEAAISVALGEPDRKAIHELRSETRRIEAELDLLNHVLGLSKDRAAELRRRLRKLRRVAGEARDCDVQRKLLKKHAGSSTDDANKDQLESDIRGLRKSLKKDRKRATVRLQRLLRRQQPKLTRDLEDVLGALNPKESEPLPADPLLDGIERSVDRTLRFREMDERRLHGVRKAAKHARYQCETLPGARAAALAKQFEELQDAGGAWHDLLVLAARASEQLGADHDVARRLGCQRDQQLANYLHKLEGFRLGRLAAYSASVGQRHGRKPQEATSASGKRPPQRETATAHDTKLRVVARKMTA